eukprot:15328559-Ditylum_brightwellii.AAC.1
MEYQRFLFKALRIIKNLEVLDTITKQRSKWTMGEINNLYSYFKLTQFVLKMKISKKTIGEGDMEEKKDEKKKEECSKFLMLQTKVRYWKASVISGGGKSKKDKQIKLKKRN